MGCVTEVVALVQFSLNSYVVPAKAGIQCLFR
jgi:hypothetical protein